jgi:hypothetical protein
MSDEKPRREMLALSCSPREAQQLRQLIARDTAALVVYTSRVLRSFAHF